MEKKTNTKINLQKDKKKIRLYETANPKEILEWIGNIYTQVNIKNSMFIEERFEKLKREKKNKENENKDKKIFLSESIDRQIKIFSSKSKKRQINSKESFALIEKIYREAGAKLSSSIESEFMRLEVEKYSYKDNESFKKDTVDSFEEWLVEDILSREEIENDFKKTRKNFWMNKFANTFEGTEVIMTQMIYHYEFVEEITSKLSHMPNGIEIATKVYNKMIKIRKDDYFLSEIKILKKLTEERCEEFLKKVENKINKLKNKKTKVKKGLIQKGLKVIKKLFKSIQTNINKFTMWIKKRKERKERRLFIKKQNKSIRKRKEERKKEGETIKKFKKMKSMKFVNYGDFMKKEEKKRKKELLKNLQEQADIRKKNMDIKKKKEKIKVKPQQKRKSFTLNY